MKVDIIKFVEKPWGYEKWLALTDSYALKEIFLKKGSRTSFQYHEKKEEHSYLIKGRLSIEEDDENGNIVVNEYGVGEITHAKPFARHRVTALEDAIYIEVSTPYLDDVVRIEDDYNRK